MIGKEEYAAQLIAADGSVRTGTLYKLLPGLTEQGRMARLLIAVSRPLDAPGARPMLLGESVRVELSGEQQPEVCVIQRRHLRNGSVVWMMDADHKLRVCPVEVIRGYADQVMVRFEFSNDWKLVTSNMSAPINGMQMKTTDETPEGRP
jgi:hypothetical protein